MVHNLSQSFLVHRPQHLESVLLQTIHLANLPKTSHHHLHQQDHKFLLLGSNKVEVK